jgi:hypothetical protein
MPFTRTSEERISEAVQNVEAMVGNAPSRRGRWHRHPNAGIPMRWGKLDNNLNAGSTETVSLWQKTGGGWDGWDEDSTENENGVYAPPTWTSGTSLASGQFVLIAKINGRWVVILPTSGVVDAAMISEFRVDGPNQKLEVKTRSVTALAMGTESGWTTIHTGTDCT